MAPAKPNNAPAHKAPKVRGKRMSITICHAIASCQAKPTDCQPVLPTPMPTKTKPAHSNDKTTQNRHAVSLLNFMRLFQSQWKASRHQGHALTRRRQGLVQTTQPVHKLAHLRTQRNHT